MRRPQVFGEGRALLNVAPMVPDDAAHSDDATAVQLRADAREDSEWWLVYGSFKHTEMVQRVFVSPAGDIVFDKSSPMQSVVAFERYHDICSGGIRLTARGYVARIALDRRGTLVAEDDVSLVDFTALADVAWSLTDELPLKVRRMAAIADRDRCVLELDDGTPVVLGALEDEEMDIPLDAADVHACEAAAQRDLEVGVAAACPESEAAPHSHRFNACALVVYSRSQFFPLPPWLRTVWCTVLAWGHVCMEFERFANVNLLDLFSRVVPPPPPKENIQKKSRSGNNETPGRGFFFVGV